VVIYINIGTWMSFDALLLEVVVIVVLIISSITVHKANLYGPHYMLLSNAHNFVLRN
jgi:hypothetical protein